MALASIGASAPTPAQLDLHRIYREQVACGYTHTLTLSPQQAQSLAARLRGIAAITGVLIAASTDYEDAPTLGNWLQGGLLDALGSLAFDAQDDLELASELAAAQQTQATKPQPKAQTKTPLKEVA